MNDKAPHRTVVGKYQAPCEAHAIRQLFRKALNVRQWYKGSSLEERPLILAQGLKQSVRDLLNGQRVTKCDILLTETAESVQTYWEPVYV